MNLSTLRPTAAVLSILLLAGCEWMSPKQGRPNPKIAPFVRTYTKPGVPEPRRVAVLPLDAPVEVEMIVEVSD